MSSEIKVDTISEKTSANGVTIDGLTIKDGNILGDVALAGTTPTFTVGDGGAEDAALIFDGNELDYYMALDDSANNLIIGSGSTVGSNSLITIDSDGDLSLDIAGDINLDAGGHDIILKGTGAEYGKFNLSGNSLNIHSSISDGDIVFKGNDGGSAVTALTLDMSGSGQAVFGSSVFVGNHFYLNDNKKAHFGDGEDLFIRSDGTDCEISATNDLTIDVAGELKLDADGGNITLQDGGTAIGQFQLNDTNHLKLGSKVSDADIFFFGNDGGSTINALRLDMSEAGQATFNSGATFGGNVFLADIIASGSGGLALQTDEGTKRLVVIDSGNVGIGTTTPSSTLHVVGDLKIDDITIDGSTISDGGTLTIDVASNLELDAGNGLFSFKDDGTEVYRITNSSGDISLKSLTSDKDISIQGNDGGSVISAVTFDMSDAGTATFNHDIKLGNDQKAIFGAGANLEIYADAINAYIKESGGSGNLQIIGQTVRIQSASDEIMIEATNDAGVDIRHNHISKLLTVSTGISLPVDGDSIKFGADSEVILTHVHDQGLKISHDGGGDPDLILANTASASDGNQLGSIFFNGQDDGGSEHTYAFMLAQARDVTAGGEDGQLIIYANKGGSDKQMISIGASANGASPQHEVCINDSGEDVDFRVESQVGTHAFFVNGASGNGTAGFYSASDSYQLMIENQNASGGRNGLFINNPSSVDTSTGVNVRSTRSSSLSNNTYFLGASNSGSDVEFRVRGDGEVTADGSFSGGGADYAEYFEWKDGNASDEDRVGYSVVLDNNKIVKATDSDDASKIIGVISVNPAVVGDGDIDRWKQKFLLDDFGREITEEITVTEWRGEHTTDEGIFNKNYLYSYDTDRIPNDVTVPSDAEVKSVDDNGNKLLRKKTNPDWNENETYISREDRKEWDTVGLMGKLRLKKGQPTGTNWIKMRDISDNVEEWLVR